MNDEHLAAMIESTKQLIAELYDKVEDAEFEVSCGQEEMAAVIKRGGYAEAGEIARALAFLCEKITNAKREINYLEALLARHA